MSPKCSMNPLPLIPIPPARRWQRFRQQYVPLLTFLITLAAVGILWNQVSRPISFMGEVENIQSALIAPEAGRVIEIKVGRYDSVKKGDLLARIELFDAGTSNARTVHLRRLIDMVGTVLRSNVDIQRLRLGLMDREVELETDQVNLEQAKDEFDRITQEFQQQIGAELPFVTASNKWKALKVQVQNKTDLLNHMHGALAELEAAEKEVSGLLAKGLDQVEEAKSTGGLELTAPLDGVVTTVDHQSGEFVRAGDIILTVSKVQPERIIG